MNSESRKLTLTRDVIGTLIPAGTRVELPAGAEAVLIQALGGSYTVQIEGHLFRVEGRDAEALGMTTPPPPEIPAEASDADIEQAVWSQLATCYDPEIPINIVDLGLIYECSVRPGPRGRSVCVKMTLTAPGCGMGDILIADAQDKVAQIPGVEDVAIELTFDPPWTREMMSEAAMLQAGFI